MNDTGPRRRSWTKRVLYLLLLLVVAGLLLWAFGPRTPVDTTVSFQSASIGDDVDKWVDDREDGVVDLRDNARKEIVWAYPASRARTPLSLVYLHGFSAAKAEIRPVPDMAAAALHANLFFTRLTGHGRNGRAMADGSVKAWIDDAAEAVAVGERIGEKVILIANSTGGSLAAVAASLPDLARNIDGIVFISPNFRIRATGASLLTAPFSATLVRLIVGKERGFEPKNEQHAQNWTARYPSSALLPMAALVKTARELPFEQMKIPALFIYDPEDQVVDQSATAEVARRWGGPSRVIEIRASGDPSNHVIAGDIMSPQNNGRIADAIVEFANGLGK